MGKLNFYVGLFDLAVAALDFYTGHSLWGSLLALMGLSLLALSAVIE